MMFSGYFFFEGEREWVVEVRAGAGEVDGTVFGGERGFRG